MGIDPPRAAACAAVAARHPAVQGLLLLGSRARDAARPDSDWDFGVLGSDDALDLLGLIADLTAAVGGAVDVAELDRAGAVLRFEASREGVQLFERSPGVVDRFRVAAADFWCEAGPVIRAAQEAMLADLGRPR